MTPDKLSANEYTSEELNLLADTLINTADGESRDLEGNHISYVTIRGFITPVASDHLLTIIFNRKHKKMLKSLHELYALIYYKSLMEIPLYINTFPEIASWRLRIGK